METALTTAIVTGSVGMITSLIASGVAIYVSVRTTKNAVAIKLLEAVNERSKEAVSLQKEISKYKEPLARASYDLQSRLYNILHLRFVETFMSGGTSRERLYAIENTCFLIGQYMCWAELARRDIQFLDLGSDDETRNLQHLQDDITGVWGTDTADPTLRLFAGEQRAIGEELIISNGAVSQCIGHGAFLKRLPETESGLLGQMRTEVASLETTLVQATPRLRAVQNALIQLLEQLDPGHVRFPATKRRRA
ncbi:hypothetical protein LGH83_16325 [Lichenihabitans sp. PAMC28606]|uniref:hypothetical protein n=1 Tax=Lichenihabitans sp. PAMC28606 TaxID=2880932 RepID=UPI001D09EEA4|nr:hypothetical protein [Lichenihabitans sp. PAMC28606]UDL94084.1 hypothetical protein LGH83_16325 [Lichenihabitans sp. PAMC28606]